MARNPEKDIWMISPEMIYAFRFVWHELKKVVEAKRPGAAFNDKPMTGFTTTMLAVQLCDEINLYGFQPYTGKRGERYHYFDKVVGLTKVHSFDLAIDIFELLADIGLTVKLVFNSPNIDDLSR